MKNRFAIAAVAVFVAATFGFAAASFAAPSSGSVTAQSSTLPPALQFAQVSFAGIYEGQVQRHRVAGGEEETRTYRLAMNPDMQNAAVWIYSRGKLITVLLVSGSLQGNTFTGKSRPVQQTTDYKPDNIRLDFEPDGRSVRWQHNDGTIMGSGVLNRI
jgi:hypothetical protein